MESINLNNNRMKTKVLFLLVFALFMSWSVMAQRGVRIGYIDTEYILQNVPEYQDANAQLESKVQKWKVDIEKRLSLVDQKKKQLNSESVLLTPELIQERQEEITIEENEILDYQHKRFGPNGDLMIQRKQLMQPVQDQIFAAVQEIAGNKQYDFVFDKSTDVVMLYSADRYDISDQVLRSITRSSKRRQATNKQEKKAAEAEDIVPEVNKEREAAAAAVASKKEERQKAIDDKRAKQLADREAKKKELDAKKQKILDDRAKAREAKINERNGAETATGVSTVNAVKNDETVEKETEKTVEKPLTEKEQRKKALEEKKKKILADRKAKLEAKRIQDSIKKVNKKKENN